MPPKPTDAWLATTAVAATSVASLNLSLSLIMTPSLLLLPTPHMLRQWAATYRRLSVASPLSIVACGVSYGALAARLSSVGSATRARLLGAAAALCLGVIPWTRLLMKKQLNEKILALADRAEGATAAVAEAGEGAVFTAQEERSAKWLVDQWGVYNLGRAIPVGIAGAIGTFALLW
ncbi:hypothetical protein F5X68DRAFT_199739 [Plectosphaerella plurivora]|uniref:DUF1772-domain-containing protein n=1 Tax=Plectosphaerella plurivora TaxID=936078 RepID=A0A9P8VL14_9PEZI|nr:hypothetical protein F5X68DRAFT_199739 [Plectosphaerella plurivora]